MLNPRRKFRETNECPFFAPRLRCPFLATLMVSHDCPPQEKRLSLPARYSQLIWPAHARLENARRKQRGGRFIALERLLSSNSFAWIHPILRVYEVWNFLFVQSDTRWAITTVLKRMWRNQVWKWHLVGTLYTRNRYIFNSFSNSRVNVLEEEWFRIFDFYNAYLNRKQAVQNISPRYSKSLASGVCSCSTFPYVSHSSWNDVRGIETSATYVETRTSRMLAEY